MDPHFQVRNLMNFVNRKHLKIAPYHPPSNGAAEHSAQTFKTALKK